MMGSVVELIRRLVETG